MQAAACVGSTEHLAADSTIFKLLITLNMDDEHHIRPEKAAKRLQQHLHFQASLPSGMQVPRGLSQNAIIAEYPNEEFSRTVTGPEKVAKVWSVSGLSAFLPFHARLEPSIQLIITMTCSHELLMPPWNCFTVP